MSHLTLTIFILVAILLYGGLGILFYTPETGFSWLFGLLGATFLVVVGIVYLVRRDLSRLEKKNSK